MEEAWKGKIKAKIFLAKKLENNEHWKIPWTLFSMSNFYDESQFS